MGKLITIVITIALVFLTSWALDWDFISRSWIRQVLVIFVMALEILLGYFVLTDQMDKNGN